MDTTFWFQRWKENEIGFHQGEANPLLVKYFNALSLVNDSRVFLPLCGKTLDIAWLVSRGYRVVGAELSEMAIKQLFNELGLKPSISVEGAFNRYSANKIEIFVGDIFNLSSELLGPVDAVYDRAALIALPEIMRQRYTAHLSFITNNAPQLLLCYEYDQSSMEGPPFSLSNEELRRHYNERYQLTLLTTIHVPEKLKGQCEAVEHAWLLKSNKTPS